MLFLHKWKGDFHAEYKINHSKVVLHEIGCYISLNIKVSSVGQCMFEGSRGHKIRSNSISDWLCKWGVRSLSVYGNNSCLVD